MKIKVNINPRILKWAREERGYTHEEICQKINVDSKEYESWEKNGRSIPYTKLKELSSYFKRQVAAFFLSEVPLKDKKPKDFRNISSVGFSKEVLFVFRKVSDFRRIALDLGNEKNWDSVYSWKEDVKSQSKLITWLRQKLEINIDQQLSFKSESEAYRRWRTAIENKLGILVFQFSMPIEEVQGFCYSDFQPNSIIVNSRHPYSARIFTLFHELGHLLMAESGICIPEQVDENQKIEYRCNKFAGEFLIPESTLYKAENLDEIRKHSNQLKVSREAYLRRLHQAELINDKEFHIFLKGIRASYKNLKSKKTGGFVKPIVRSKAERGETFYSMVIRNLNANQISYTNACEILGLNLRTLLSEI